jgi:hypothetical protein
MTRATVPQTCALRLGCPPLLGDQFNVDAVIQRTGLDRAAVVAALRLYECDESTDAAVT